MEPLPIHDVPAEQALLGAALAAPDIAGPTLLTVPADAWWTERHRTIAAVLTDRLRRDQPVDPTLVLSALVNRRSSGDQIGPYLITLMERAWAPANAPYHADRIRACAASRALVESCRRTIQRVEILAANGDELDLAPLVADLETAAQDAVAESGSTTPIVVPTVLDLLASEDQHDWLVPHLLERAERILITGSEGLGKSVLVTQIAVCLAGGVHPFAAYPLNQMFRVLVIDCENTESLARRRYRRMVPLVNEIRAGHRDEAPPWGEHLFIEFRSDGLDLLGGRDVAWLENHVAATSPDLLVLGPLYKLHQTNINDEHAARELTAALDRIRHRHSCALLSEAHAGNAEDNRGRRVMRPIGSSLFRRWPEFGYGLLRASDCQESEHPSLIDMVAWRGSREERSWPRKLRHGHAHLGELPWTPDQRADNVVPLADRDVS